MKILHINGNYLTTALHQTMIEHLERAGMHNSVIAPTYNADDCAIKLNENVIPAQCFKKSDRFFFGLKQKKIIRFIKEKVQVQEYDIIHAYTLFTDGNSAYELSKQYNIPYVVAVRNTDLNHFFKLRIALRKRGIEILENASAVFFLSDAYKDKLFSQYVPKERQDKILEKSYVIPNGINSFWIENKYVKRNFNQVMARMEQKALNVVCVAQITQNKNIPMLQNALQLLREEGWKVHLTVVGKPIDEAELRVIMKDPNTTYIEPVPKEKLIDYYRDADIFALASHHETFGLVYAEAMSQGLPVLYTRGQGFDGQFEDGVVGYTIDDKSAADIADKIKLAAENYCILARNGLQFTEKFRWTDVCAQYIDIYKRILGY